EVEPLAVSDGEQPAADAGRLASSVDLPAPFGPTSANSSPARTSRSEASSASWCPYRRDTPRAASSTARLTDVVRAEAYGGGRSDSCAGLPIATPRPAWSPS